MAKLIDAMLIDFDEVDISECTDVDDIIWAVEKLIDVQPAVDAVKVVRCKDCRHWIERTADGVDSFHICWFNGSITGKNHFCCYGERKENENNT